MKRYKLSHLSDTALLREFAALLSRGCEWTADLLAHMAEVDSRKLYRPAGYESMYTYCLGALHMSEDVAYKRIKAARAARRFPAVFTAVGEGRVHLSAVVMLAPHLTRENSRELLEAAAHQSKSQIALMLAQRFPQPDIPTWVQPLVPPAPIVQQAPGPVASLDLAPAGSANLNPEQAPGPVPATDVPPPTPDRGRIKPLAPQRFGVQFTMSQSLHDKLRYAEELLGHQVTPGDLAQIFERALDALIPQLEKHRFSATAKPRPQRRPRASSDNPRHIPAHVRREAWKRDGGRCTYVSESGQRCEARKGLQFDHVAEVARGGEAGVGDLRLLCWAHNQYAAECTFGAEFMRHKRIAASEARAVGSSQGTPD